MDTCICNDGFGLNLSCPQHGLRYKIIGGIGRVHDTVPERRAWPLKTTMQDILQAKPQAEFFRELIDVASTKCYGTQLLTAAEVQAEVAAGRVVGFYGQKERTFTEPFEIQRGHKIVVVRASAKKPVRCFEHVFAEYV